MGFFTYALITIAVNIASQALNRRPTTGGRTPTQDLQEPTAEAGKPVPVLFGEMTIKSPNTLWYGDITKRSRKVKA